MSEMLLKSFDHHVFHGIHMNNGYLCEIARYLSLNRTRVLLYTEYCESY